MAKSGILSGVLATTALAFFSASAHAGPEILGAISAAEARSRTAEIVYANLMQAWEEGQSYRQISNFMADGRPAQPIPNPGGTAQRMTQALQTFTETFDRTGNWITASGRDELLTSMGRETGGQVATNLRTVLAQRAQWIQGWIERAPRSPVEREAYYARAASQIANEVAAETVRPIGAQLDAGYTAFRANPKPPSMVELMGGPRGLLSDEQVLARVNAEPPTTNVGKYIFKNGKIRNAADLAKLVEAEGHFVGDLKRVFPNLERIPQSMITISERRGEYVRQFRQNVSKFDPAASPSRITFGRGGQVVLDAPARPAANLAGTVAREERFVQLSLAEQRGVLKGLAEIGVSEAGTASKGMTVIRAGGRILFWAGMALMVYDGVSGSVEAVREGDPIADFVAAHSPLFMASAVRNTVAAASGFTQGVVNGMISPATLAFEYTQPGVFIALGGPQALAREREQRMNAEVQAMAKVALQDGKRIYGQDYQLPQSYLDMLKGMAAAKESPTGGAAR